MFEISEQLNWNNRMRFFGVSQNQLGKFIMETVISDQWWTSHQSLVCKDLNILRFCVMSLKDESEPNIKYFWERQLEWFKDSCQFWTLDTIDGEPMEFEWNIFTRFTTLGACPRSPKVHKQNRRHLTIPRTNYLHVDVQWHHMVK